MSEQFTIEIISPDEQTLKTEAREVSLPAFEGEIGILKDHIPLITFLRPGLIKIFSKTDQIYFVEDGTVEFVNNNLLILTSTARPMSSIDKKSLEDLINVAEKKINDSGISDKERYLLSYKIDTLKNINL
tara:strand:- start:107 stop:496 length:390 start_codon:yes stop_codon:yes gene_type:complete